MNSQCLCGFVLLALLAACSAPSEQVSPPAAPPPAERGLQFVDITQAAGLDFVHVSGTDQQAYILESMGGGVALLDYDGDTYLDIFLVNGTRLDAPSPPPTNRLYRNSGDAQAPSFTDVTAAAGLIRSGWGMGAATGDVDGDGAVDLYVTYWGPNVLYRNRDNASFALVGDQADAPGWSTSAAFGDWDLDGDLDLYITNYLEFDQNALPNDGIPCRGWKGLETFCGPHGMTAQTDALYRNEGAGTFTDMSAVAGLDAYRHPGLGVVWGDYDDDGDQDIYVANDSQPNLLWRNDGTWRPTEIGAMAGLAYSEDGRAQAGMGVDAGDYDGDGDLDLFVTNFSDDVNTLYQNQGGTFVDATAAAGLAGAVRPYLGWSTAFFDADNDGWLDLFVANGHLYPQLETHPSGLRYAQANLFYWNQGGRFRLAEAGSLGPALTTAQVSRGAAFGDLDNDGDIDLVVANLNDRPALLRNDGGNRHNWLGLDLEGEASTSAGVGARVDLWTGGQRQTREAKRGYGYNSQHDGRLLFGLGGATRVERLDIRWPSGQRQTLTDLPLRRYLVVREGQDTPLRTYGHQRHPPPMPPTTIAAADSSSLPTVAPYAGQTDWNAQDHYRQGVDLYRQGRYPEAQQAFTRAIALNPGYIEAHYSLGTTLYSGLGRPEQALTILDQAIARDSTRAPLYELLGAVHLSRDQPDRATQALERAARLDSTSWSIANRLGLAQLRGGDSLAALAAFHQAAGRAPYQPQPHLRLAQLYRQLGRTRDAADQQDLFEQVRVLAEKVDQYERDLHESPQDPQTHYLLGQAYYAQGRRQQAEASFRRALEANPDFGPAYYGLGALLRQAGQFDRAVAAYRQAVTLQPDLVGAWADLGQIYYLQRRHRQAAEAFSRALVLNPDRLAIRTQLAQTVAAQGRYDEAAATFQTVLAADSTQTGARDGLARTYFAQGHYQLALDQWQILRRLAPSYPHPDGLAKRARQHLGRAP
ncbi:MAG: tetratricopeptide repeat protein [Candidatus Latescibacteria bacterium]|nr:tetratricopeptide repeat protein [Candidatus Latescibacterota bacterium]